MQAVQLHSEVLQTLSLAGAWQLLLRRICMRVLSPTQQGVM